MTKRKTRTRTTASRQPADHTHVAWFRRAAPYIHAHRGRVFVIAVGGEAIASRTFANLIHDIALLHALGVRIVLVHGARPQIDARLAAMNLKPRYAQGLRVTDAPALEAVKAAVGALRIDIEALLTTGVPNTPMAGARVRVASGNFVVAQPRGVRHGVDFEHTGEVRRVEAAAIRQHLEHKEIVLLSPLGYSPTGETFNLSNEDVATAAAIALRADKLVFLTETRLTDAKGRAVTQLSPADADAMLAAKKGPAASLAPALRGAMQACRNAVARAHLVPRALDGGLLIELYTRDGVGTLVTAQGYESLRPAIIEDAGGILELIAPLEASGALVRRSREQLELEIAHFEIIERDGMVIGCAALYPFASDGVGELACLAIHPDYRGEGRGDALLRRMEERAAEQKLRRIFVLTTQTAHWFREHGFTAGDVTKLPVERQSLYNWQRNSKIFFKKIVARRR